MDMSKKRIFVPFVIILAFVLAYVATMAVVLRQSSFAVKANSISDAAVRTIETSTTEYAETAKAYIAKFENAAGDRTETNMSMNAEMSASLGDMLGVDCLADSYRPLKKTFKTEIDLTTDKLHVIVTYWDGELAVETSDLYADFAFDEEKNDGYVVLDGEKLYLAQIFEEEQKEDCFLLTLSLLTAAALALCAIALVATVAYTISILPPMSIPQLNFPSFAFAGHRVERAEPNDNMGSSGNGVSISVNVNVLTKLLIVLGIVQAVAATPALIVDNVRIETRQVSIDKLKDLVGYYLCFVDPSNNLVYVSRVEIPYVVAVLIMAMPQFSVCIGNRNKDMVASIYNFSKDLAYAAAAAAVISPTTPYGNPDCHADGFLQHYHSIMEVLFRDGTSHAAHSFFGGPSYKRYK